MLAVPASNVPSGKPLATHLAMPSWDGPGESSTLEDAHEIFIRDDADPRLATRRDARATQVLDSASRELLLTRRFRLSVGGGTDVGLDCASAGAPIVIGTQASCD